MSDVVPLVEELVPVPDPWEVCGRFADAPFLLFLDSAGDSSARGRFSFLAADPPVVIRSRAGVTERLSCGTGRWAEVSGDPLAVAQAELSACSLVPDPELPPFQGGVAGYIGYEWGSALEAIGAAPVDDLGIPDVALGCYDWVIAWDHAAHRAWIVATGLPDCGPARLRRAAARLGQVKARLTGAPGRIPGGVTPLLPEGLDGYSVAALGRSVRSTFTRDTYLAAVERVVRHIRAGDIFQANLAQRFEAPLVGSPLAFYGRLRARNPAPFSAYLQFQDVVVASASPERFLSTRDSGVEARPIKGTRPRGRTPAEDDALREELETSEKDLAENAMIVDVVRNDLSRVCLPGSVRAPELFTVERYATVQHLVSRVVGEAKAGCSFPEIVRATFPSGSVTGAPKIRAMQIISALEPTTRGVYCGAVGYWGSSGVGDMSVAIRTCVVKGGKVYFHAGGGVLAESDPAREYEETLHKARGIAEALTP